MGNFNDQSVSIINQGVINVVNANGDTGLATVGSAVVAPVAGYSGCAFQLVMSGSWSGTVKFEFSCDNGATWNAGTYNTTVTGTPSSSTFTASTSSPQFPVLLPGVTHVRFVCTVYVAGTCTVLFSNTIGGIGGATGSGGGGGGGGTPTLYQANGDNSTVAFNIGFTPANPTAILVYVGGLLQRLTTDYTFSVNTVTFGTAPPAGTSNVAVFGI